MSFRPPIRRLRYHASSLLTGFIRSLLACTARSSTTIGGPCRAWLVACPCEHRQDRVTINTLPDDVLVEVFHFYVNHSSIGTNEWHTLVHVCQRWRHVVFALPRRLNLRLDYTGKRPISELLDVWPVSPVAMSHGPDSLNSWEHLVGALESEHHHRICQIDLWPIPTSELEKLAAAMQKPFPELTSLLFWAKRYTVTPLSDSFLGGSAPLLRELWLHGCPFPGIPKLLLSSNQLVVLSLWNIPNSGYISPQDLVTALSVSSRLEILRLGFESPLHPRCRPPPPFTRSVLPALTRLDFKGVHAYLEVLVAQIEAPLLDRLCVTFFMDFDFVLPQLHRLISQTESFNSCDRATVRTSDSAIQFAISRETRQFPVLLLEIMQSDGQLSSLAQVCSSSFPLSTLVQLDIIGHCWLLHQTNNMVTTQWVEFLAPFTAVKDLRLSDQVEQHVCKALAELAEERRADVLPALRNIFLRHFLPWEIEGFVAARRLSGHPVAVHRWR